MRIRIKQRLFTRGEKRAFRELYKATKGFKEIPKTNNPRDVLRLKRLAKDFKRYSLGDIKNIDVDNAKELLNNAGLHQTANELEHAINKYSNKKALVRLKNIKNKNISEDFKKVIGSDNKRRSRQVKRGRQYAKELDNSDKELTQNLRPFGGFRDRIAYTKLKSDAKKRGIEITKPNSDPEGKYVGKNGLAAFRRRIEPNSKDYDPRRPNIIPVKYTKGSGKIYTDELVGRDLNTTAHEYGHARSSLQSLMKKSGISDIKEKSIDGLKTKKFKKWGAVEYDYGKDRISTKAKDLRQAASSFDTLSEEYVANSYAKARLKRIGRDSNFRKMADANQRNYISSEKLQMTKASMDGIDNLYENAVQAVNKPNYYFKK